MARRPRPPRRVGDAGHRPPPRPCGESTGDGVVAHFDGPARAIRGAIELDRSARELGLALRTGLHTGEIKRRGDDIAGVAVPLAARVQAEAQPGEILVSRTVVDLVAGSGLEFEPRGEHALKGVPGAWALFAVRGTEAG